MLLAIQVVSAIILGALVLVQDRGSGLGGAVGGSAGGEVFTTRRGAEKVLHRLTILFAIVFVGSVAAEFFVKSASPTTPGVDALPPIESGAEAPAAVIPDLKIDGVETDGGTVKISSEPIDASPAAGQ